MNIYNYFPGRSPGRARERCARDEHETIYAVKINKDIYNYFPGRSPGRARERCARDEHETIYRVENKKI
jgi:hypothetical protein